ncbi:helix-turn-helix domain-containing protein [Shewanella sp. AS1]|uniref:winged helix-turn-helix domain-containing protein n=1 Tax=Shewanella sp. AS1 TaxID=2907626 RepID=UPI001F266E72|nr:helix-turn-helix domain-containing protein [Shewanella sp. AS1]MCE9677774.1 helix-turn-helix domain-containing protein [Shewanella sp. AS1]
MQIGHCLFDMTQAQLSNLENDTSWTLPEVEFNVLQLLASHRGQVVSNQQLLACFPAEASNIENLEKVIGRIRFFFGKSCADLIESIDSQGYILHNKVEHASRSAMGPLNNKVTPQRYLLMVSQLVLLLLLLYSVFDPSDKLTVVNEQQLHTKSGDLGFFPIFTSPEDEESAAAYISHFLHQVQDCQSIHWDKMFYSLSEDKRVLNIALKRDNSQGLKIKNVKAIDPATHFTFIDQNWLKSMEICS